MTKAVVISGSPRKEESISYQISKRILEKIKEEYNTFEYDILILSCLNIQKCKGCARCFIEGNGCMSNQDDMRMVEQKLIEANLIILTSPVYSHNVSGDMKIFVDRLSYWSHLFRLVGKYGITISSSSTNGNCFVDQYLINTLRYWGVDVIGNISYTSNTPVNIFEINQLVKQVINIFDTNEVIDIEAQEKIFQFYKHKYRENYQRSCKDSSVPLTAESRFWIENKYFEYDSFKELFLDRVNI